MRRSNGARRRGISRGLHGRRITTTGVAEFIDLVSSSTIHYTITILQALQDSRKLPLLLGKWAKQSFTCAQFICTKSYLIPMVPDANGGFEMISGWRRILHCMVYTVFVSTIVHKFIVCIRLISAAEWGIISALSFAGFLLQLVPFCSALGVVFHTTETISLHRDWSVIFSNLKQGCRPDCLFNDLGAGLQLLFLVFGVLVSVPDFPLFSIVYDSVPIFIFATLREAGIIDGTGMISMFGWQLLIYPFELLMYGLPLTLMTFCGHFDLLEMELFKVYVKQVKQMKINDLTSRREVERLYILIQIHNKKAHGLLRIIMFPCLFTIAWAVVICLYIPIRHDIPAFLSFCFVFVAAMLMLVVFGASLEVLVAVRNSEEIIAKLQSIPLNEADTSELQRRRYLKRAKALRPLSFPLGIFGDFSLQVPVIIWDEILNQLLFLLSL